MTAGNNPGTDIGTGGGDWLFRHSELVIGPVSAAQIVEKLYSGEIAPTTPVAPMGSAQFQPVAEVDYFRLHVAKAQARLRVEAAERDEQHQDRKRRGVKIALGVFAALLLATGATLTARYLAIHNPFKDADELAFAEITVEPPVITVARSNLEDEELLVYPGTEEVKAKEAVASGAKRKVEEKAAVAEKPKRGAKLVAAATPKPPRRAAPARSSSGNSPADPDGLQMSANFDREAINAVVASHQKTLHGCLSQEAKRNPDLAGKIPIEFVIGNNGRVAKLWIDHRAGKSGSPLYECMQRALSKWPFRAYEGEQATVGLAFNIGRRQ